MTHACGCHASAPEVEGARKMVPTVRPPVTADRTVADVARHEPGALEVMKQMGINHCCGAHLTLAEAAAAAGVPVETLLVALTKAERAPA